VTFQVLLRPYLLLASLLPVLFSPAVWAEILVEIKGDEVFVTEKIPSSGISEKYSLGKLTTINKGTRFYHWGSDENIQRWKKQGRVDSGELDFLITQPEGQLAGGGFYGSKDPLDSMSFGKNAIAIELSSDLKGVRGSYPSLITDKIELAKKLRAKGISFLNYNLHTWFNFIDPAALQTTAAVSSGDFLKSPAFDKWISLSALEKRGLIDLRLPEVQKRHRVFAKILLGQAINSKSKEEVWSQVEKGMNTSGSEFSPRLIQYFRPEIQAVIVDKVRRSAAELGTRTSWTYESYIRQGRGFGLDYSEILGATAPHRPKVPLVEIHPQLKDMPSISKLDPFGQKLARAMEFIDYNDLLLEMAQGKGEPWRRYDLPGQRPLLDRWIEATGPKLKDLSNDSLEMKLAVHRLISGDSSADIRGTPVVAGGDTIINGKGYYRVTELEKKALEANPYLTVDIIPDPSARPGQRLYLGRHEYPSAMNYKKFANHLSSDMLTELRAAEEAGQLTDPELTRKVLRHLLNESHTGMKTSLELYQTQMSIHPFADYNGRTFRAIYQRRSKKPLFLRDFDHDLLLAPQQFIPEAINGEGQLLAIRQKMLEEYSRNPASPKYYDIPEIWRVAVESELKPKDPADFVRQVKASYLNPENQNLIHQKKFFDFDIIIKKTCVSRRIEMFFKQ